MKYLFQLGFARELALQEIACYLLRYGLKYEKQMVDNNTLIIKTNDTINTQNAISTLGGTVRIAEFIDSADSQEYVIGKIVKHILTYHKSGKLNFSLFNHAEPEDSLEISKKIKEAIAEKGFSSRFQTEDTYLSPIKLTTQHVHEYILLTSANHVSIFYTSAISDFRGWQARDRSRPKNDPSSGMLPPKIARIMLNLAFTKPFDAKNVVLDPFCGSGTILAEALTMGLSCIGSDTSQRAIDDSQENLTWLKPYVSDNVSFKLKKQDATILTKEDIDNQVDAIVFEGYLGPPKFTWAELPQIIDDLEDLYSKALPNLNKVLKSGSKLVMALPRFDHSDSVKMLASLIDTCENSGYTLMAGPVLYSKPNSRLKRAIYVLSKN